MVKYLITWNAGYGEVAESVDADSQDEAENMAYERWREDCESQADYSAEQLTEELAEEHGVAWEPDT